MERCLVTKVYELSVLSFENGKVVEDREKGWFIGMGVSLTDAFQFRIATSRREDHLHTFVNIPNFWVIRVLGC